MKDNEVYILNASSKANHDKTGNTCVYYFDNSMVFIDCGKARFLALENYKPRINELLKNHKAQIKQLFLVVTHPHEDHYTTFKDVVKIIKPESAMAIVFKIPSNKTYSAQDTVRRNDYDLRVKTEINSLKKISWNNGKKLNVLTIEIPDKKEKELEKIPGVSGYNGMDTTILNNVVVYGNEVINDLNQVYGVPDRRSIDRYVNDVGVVVKIKRDNDSVLFTGDMSYHFWYDAYKNDGEIKHIVLPHHGGFAWIADVAQDVTRSHFYKDTCELYLSSIYNDVIGDEKQTNSPAYFVKEAFNVNPKKIKSTKDGMITI